MKQNITYDSTIAEAVAAAAASVRRAGPCQAVQGGAATAAAATVALYS